MLMRRRRRKTGSRRPPHSDGPYRIRHPTGSRSRPSRDKVNGIIFEKSEWVDLLRLLVSPLSSTLRLHARTHGLHDGFSRESNQLGNGAEEVPLFISLNATSRTEAKGLRGVDPEHYIFTTSCIGVL